MSQENKRQRLAALTRSRLAALVRSIAAVSEVVKKLEDSPHSPTQCVHFSPNSRPSVRERRLLHPKAFVDLQLRILHFTSIEPHRRFPKMDAKNPKTLLDLSIQSLLRNESALIQALEDIPRDVFVPLFIAAFQGGHKNKVIEMVKVWPFYCLHIGSLTVEEPQHEVMKAMIENFPLSLKVQPPLMFPMTVTLLGRDQDCSLKIRELDVAAPWFLDPGGWSKTSVASLYFIFPGICTLSLREDVILEWIFLPRKPNKKLKTYIEKICDLIHKERVVLHIETAEFIPDNTELTSLFIQLQEIIRNREHPIYITHIRSHTGLPGPLAQGYRPSVEGSVSSLQKKEDKKPLCNRFTKMDAKNPKTLFDLSIQSLLRMSLSYSKLWRIFQETFFVPLFTASFQGGHKNVVIEMVKVWPFYCLHIASVPAHWPQDDLLKAVIENFVVCPAKNSASR
ncbi:hypothetical protein STEG23_027609 [Scotinomys teguina]